MIDYFKVWYKRYFSHEEAVLMVIVILLACGVTFAFGRLLAPVFVALVFAYLMQGVVNVLNARGVPHLIAVGLVYTFFLGVLFILLVWLLPLAWSQMIKMFNEQLPRISTEVQSLLYQLPERYPEFVTQQQVDVWLKYGQTAVANMGQKLLSLSITNLPNLMVVLVFLVLVPVLVFFFMKDKDLFIRKFIAFLPNNKGALEKVWSEMDQQISNYIRGKALEIFIVGGASYTCFAWMDLNYAELLAVIVGLSVLIPYIGAAVVTLPVVLVAYFQFGFEADFYKIMFIYGVIQVLDGNVLVPLLFSEAVNLHPVAIIVAVLVFGGLWGVWGVFFAIPLATLVKAVFTAWPRQQLTDSSHP